MSTASDRPRGSPRFLRKLVFLGLAGTVVLIAVSAIRLDARHRVIAFRLLDDLTDSRLEVPGSPPPNTSPPTEWIERTLSEADWEPFDIESIHMGIGGRLTAWRTRFDLPAESASIEMLLDGKPMSRWHPDDQPRPLSVLISSGAGFIPTGMYVVLPTGQRPDFLPLSYRFRPDRTLLLEHAARSGSIADPKHLLSRVRVGANSFLGLQLPAPVSLRVRSAHRKGSVLHFGLATRPKPWVSSPQPLTLRVLLHQGDSAQVLLETNIPTSLRPSTTWFDTPLPDTSRDTEIEFSMQSIDPESSAFSFLADPTISTISSRPRRKTNLLLVVVDGLRADRIRREPAEDVLAPAVGELASGGTAFSNAYSASSWTRPSIASLFTGTWPPQHQVHTEEFSAQLPPDLPTLASTLANAGYDTGGFSANMHLVPAFGLQKGFRTFHSQFQDGRELVEAARDWITRRAGEPYFAFVFLMDTHYPLKKRPEFSRSDGMAGTVIDVNRFGARSRRRRKGIEEPTQEDIALLKARYDENVSYVDHLIGKLLEDLSVRNLLRDTVVVVTADHGEAFGEHGDFFHGWNLYEELIRVPLVIAGPGVRRGQENPEAFSQVELAGGLLRLLGVPAPEFDSDSRWKGAGIERSQPVYTQTHFRGRRLMAIVDRGYKLILDRTQDRAYLFDLNTDPGEVHDISSERPELVHQLETRLRLWVKTESSRYQPWTLADQEALDPEVRRQLRALGYAD